MFHKIIFFIALFLIFAPKVWADATTPIERANRAYQEGKFELAASSYETALKEGIRNGHVYYNLGNTYFRLGRYGKAIAAYRMAQRSLPRDPDIQANLTLARAKAKDKIDAEESPSLSLEFLPRIAKTTLRRFFLLFYAAAWVAFLFGNLFSATPLRQIGYALLIISLPLAGTLYFTREGRLGNLEFAFSEDSRLCVPAVIISQEAKVYSGDGENYQVVFMLHEGAEVMSAEHRDDWIQVYLPGGRKGWLKKGDIDMLNPEDT